MTHKDVQSNGYQDEDELPLPPRAHTLKEYLTHSFGAANAKLGFLRYGLEISTIQSFYTMCLGLCCFTGATTVATNKGVKRMDELGPSDDLLTLSIHRGSPKWTSFYTWGHREPNFVTEFIVLKMNNGKHLEMTREHLIFVVGEEGKRVAKKADQVTTGDQLYHYGGRGNEAVELVSVIEISVQSFTGIYAPYTMSGHLLANGFLVACYANVESFKVGHAAMAPLRSWYRLRQPSKKITKDGLHIYVKGLVKGRELLPPPFKNLVI